MGQAEAPITESILATENHIVTLSELGTFVSSIFLEYLACQSCQAQRTDYIVLK